jgi:hypothetical protein
VSGILINTKKGIKKTAERDRFFQNNCLHCNFLFLMVLTGRNEKEKNCLGWFHRYFFIVWITRAVLHRGGFQKGIGHH